MESYKLKWKSSAKKELKKIPKNNLLTILDEIEKLTSNPFPTNYKKIQGVENIYRLKVNNYRVIYKLENDELIIEVIRVRHRKDVYRNFP